MDAKKLTGVKAGSLKYDLLTALSVAGLHLDPRHQISTARMMVLITARYNWRQDEFCVGQRDLARMWNVTERTVKREIKFWLEQRWVICKRQGVRGRVGAYRLNYAEVYRMSQPFWAKVGPDFQERMTETNPVREAKVVAVDFRASQGPVAEPETDHESWRAAARRMRELQPEHYRNWLSAMSFGTDDGRILVLNTQNRFVAHYIQTHLMGIVSEAVQATLGNRRRIEINVVGGGART